MCKRVVIERPDTRQNMAVIMQAELFRRHGLCPAQPVEGLAPGGVKGQGRKS